MVAGSAGAGCMSVLRMAARRTGLIHATPPQATRAWLAERTGVEHAGAGVRQLLDSLVHLAVGVGGGAIYGALVRKGERPPLAAGGLFGLGLWAVAFGAVAPALGITRSPRESTWRETAVNVAAHLAYGVAMAVVAGELSHQAHAGATTRPLWRARVG
jgi:uncharacterized membrane protein YagU involved in acid resistance